MTVPGAPVAHGRRVFRNTLITGAVGVFSLLANFFVIGLAVRRLGMGPYGVLTLAIRWARTRTESSRWHWRSRCPPGI